ncbi:hypothetical protein FACS1894184_16630 [Clostridia bacterium]|nr:hypothetical protein FACS1894184_16630 [Clostridia bacterium]
MGYTGPPALRFKEAYTKKFSEMEKTLAALKLARADFPLLTEAIRLSHENPRPHHFLNECDMINRIAMGMTAKEYKISNEIPIEERSIRPHLTARQLALIEWLQMLDAGMITGGMTFESRKNALTTAALEKFTITTMKAILKRVDIPTEELLEIA